MSDPVHGSSGADTMSVAEKLAAEWEARHDVAARGGRIDPGRETVALCRCGKSGIKPFCDGAHKRAGFSAPSAPSRPRPAAEIVRESRRPES